MIKYILSNKRAKFLLSGIVMTIIGFVMQYGKIEASRYLFYIAIILLGYYPFLDAIEKTFVEKKPNDALLMILSAIGAVIINYESEGAILLVIYAGAEVLEDFVKAKSTKSIEELMNHMPSKANIILPDGSTKEVETKDLKIGDKVFVAKGDQIPVDGNLLKKATVNEASITGESVPVNKSVGQEAFAGTLNVGDAFELEVSKEEKDTLFSNIVRMVEQAQARPSKSQRIIESIEGKYVTGVLIVVPLFILTMMYISGYTFQDAFYRGIVLLTVASPCALVASVSPATLSAISNGAKNGILFKDGRAIEIFSEIDIVATDKTGTLTYGQFEVTDYKIPEDLIAKIVYMEQASNHPIAKAIVKKFDNVDLSKVYKSNLSQVEEVAGKGLRMGDLLITNLSKNETIKDPNKYKDIDKGVNTISHISQGDEIVGYIMLTDQVRETAIHAVQGFNAEGVKVVMLTGDNEKVANDIAEKIGIDDYRSGLLPQDKTAFVQEMQDKDKALAMIGDGINDAPALANADLGISMGSGTSIAMESSDIVIVKNDLNRLFHSYKLSEKLKKIIYQNLIFAIAVICVLIVLNISGYLDLPTGVIFHETSTILVILNGLRLLNFSFDQ